MDVACFRRPDDPTTPDGPSVLHPEPTAAGLWAGGTQMRGSAVSGALARQAERIAAVHGGPDLRPVRWTLDLFRPAGMRESVVTGRVVRAGRRLCLVDVVFRQETSRGPADVARASALFLARGQADPGEVWSAQPPVVLPPADLRPGTTEPRLYFSEGTGWTSTPQAHQNSRRKRVWLFGVPVVRGESPTPFQLTAAAGDVTNFVANWGSSGIAFINADVGVTMARLPVGEEIGLATELRIEHEGIVAAVAGLFDRGGVFGTATVSSLAGSSGPIDPRQLGEPLPAGTRAG